MESGDAAGGHQALLRSYYSRRAMVLRRSLAHVPLLLRPYDHAAHWSRQGQPVCAPASQLQGQRRDCVLPPSCSWPCCRTYQGLGLSQRFTVHCVSQQLSTHQAAQHLQVLPVICLWNGQQHGSFLLNGQVQPPSAHLHTHTHTHTHTHARTSFCNFV